MKTICTLCSAEADPERYTEGCRERVLMEELSACFTCAFWEGIARKKIRGLRIEGCHYEVERDLRDRNRGFAGMGGRRFDIELADGRRFTTHNLWHQGEIPAHFRERLPDNATFIGATRETVGGTTCWNPTPGGTIPYPSFFDLKPAGEP